MVSTRTFSEQATALQLKLVNCMQFAKVQHSHVNCIQLFPGPCNNGGRGPIGTRLPHSAFHVTSELSAHPQRCA